MKQKLNKIRRFRLSDDLVEILDKMKNQSSFVRGAIREKMEREKLLKKIKIPF